MSSKKKPQLSFLEQASLLEEENNKLKESLNNYHTLVNTIAKTEFGMDAKSVKKALLTGGDSQQEESIFEKKICSYFGLSTEADREDFLKIMLSPSCINYFSKKKFSDEETATEQDSY